MRNDDLNVSLFNASQFSGIEIRHLRGAVPKTTDKRLADERMLADLVRFEGALDGVRRPPPPREQPGVDHWFFLECYVPGQRRGFPYHDLDPNGWSLSPFWIASWSDVPASQARVLSDGEARRHRFTQPCARCEKAAHWTVGRITQIQRDAADLKIGIYAMCLECTCLTLVEEGEITGGLAHIHYFNYSTQPRSPRSEEPVAAITAAAAP
jgi:hypothetical protein